MADRGLDSALVIAGDLYGVLFNTNERGEANAVLFGFLVALLLPTVLLAIDTARHPTGAVPGRPW